MTDIALPDTERGQARRQFRQDIRKHVHDISSRYIVEGETSNGALMFIPAEAVFAEIHAHHPEVVSEAQRQRVWLVSPTTLMAVLTTARAVLRDVATQEQVHVIREHLHGLSKDFGRFQERMDRLSTHIARAHRDVEDVHKSASRISGRFRRIEEVDLDENPTTLPLPDTAVPEPGEASR
jgi:DNA recombination protein RmuC